MVEHTGSWQVLNTARKELVFGTAIGTTWIAAKEQEHWPSSLLVFSDCLSNQSWSLCDLCSLCQSCLSFSCISFSVKQLAISRNFFYNLFCL